MMFQDFISNWKQKTLLLVIGLQIQYTNGGLLDAVGILGNTLQGTQTHAVPNLLNQVVGGVSTNQGNLAGMHTKIPNQMQPQHQVTIQQRPTVNNYLTTATLNNQQVYPSQNYVTNVQRPNVAFQQQRPMIIQHEYPNNNGFNPQNTDNTGQLVFIPHKTGQNYQQNGYPIGGNGIQNELQNQNIGQNGFQYPEGQNNMQQLNNANMNSQPSNQNIYQNHRPTTTMGQFGDQNPMYNNQQGLSTGQQYQQQNNNANFGGNFPPSGAENIGNINHNINKVQGGGHYNNDGHKDHGHQNDYRNPVKKDDEDKKVHSTTVHNVFFQAKPLIVDELAKDE